MGFTVATAAPATAPSTLTFTEILDRFDDVTEDGNGYAAACPSHSDSHPSLRVALNADTHNVLVRCRVGCETETVLAAASLTMADLFDVDPGDLTAVRTTRSDMAAVSTADRAALAQYLDRAAAAFPDSPAAAYALTRFGVDPARGADLGLGFDDGSLPTTGLTISKARYHDTPRLVIPFNDFEGRPHYLQARALSNDVEVRWSGPRNPEGSAWGKYGFISGGTGWADVIVTEGPGDALTASTIGFDVVLIRGAGLARNTAIMDEIAAGLQGRRVLIAGDNDSAGQDFTKRIAETLSRKNVDVRRLTIPADVGTDLTDWRKSLGSAFRPALIEAVKSAPKYGSDQIVAEEIGQDVSRLFSDLYNAQTLHSIIREDGNDVRWTSALGFLVYSTESGVWEPDSKEWVRRQAHKVAVRVQRAILREMSAMDSRVATIDDVNIRTDTGKLLDAQRRKARSGALISNVESTRGIDSMLRELRALNGVACGIDEFDRHPSLLAVGNGVLDLSTQTLRPYSEETKSLYLTQKIHLPYRPGARNPRWDAFLSEVFDGDTALVEFIQRLIGYGITGFTSEQCFAVLWGKGSNGKSVFTDVLARVFSGISRATPFATFEQKPSGGIPNDLAALRGQRLVMASEGEQGKKMAEATLKQLTGGDVVSARFLNKEFFEFRPSFLILLATNYRPNFRGQDEGLWRRVKMIPFSRYFAKGERDQYLVQKLSGAEGIPTNAYRPAEDYGDGPAGILAWAVEGASRWAREGLHEPRQVIAATDEYRENQDALAGFYAENLVRDPEGKIRGTDVWKLYQAWIEEERLEKSEQWKRATFFAALEERGATRTMPQGSVMFRGIRKRKESDPHPKATPAEPDAAVPAPPPIVDTASGFTLPTAADLADDVTPY